MYGQPATLVDQMPKRRSFDELHDDVRGAVVVTGVVRGHDPRVRELRRRDRFVAKAHAQRLVDRELGQEHLDRDRRDSSGSSAIHTVAMPPRQLAVEAVAPAEDASGCGSFRHVTRR